MVVLTRGAQRGIYTRGDRSKTKIRDPRMAGDIHKDIWLDTCKWGGEAGVRPMTHPFEVPMNYITGVEVT